MVEQTDVAIVGAGPYGLSLAAHLRAAGIEHRVFGKVMDSWRNRMPPGMVLKSHGWSSNLSDPGGRQTLAAFCAERDLPYHDRLLPAPLETFVAYGQDFQRRLVPNVESRTVVRLDRLRAGYCARFDDGGELLAKRVALAVGVHPFAFVPPALRGLPAGLVSHSGDWGKLDALSGRRVVVIGSGASATDLTALLCEAGASATLVARARDLVFAPPPAPPSSLARRVARTFRAAISPNSGIGRGWPLKICADAPELFHMLPEAVRHDFVKSALGPLGTASMREKLIGRAPILLGRTVEAAAAARGRVALTLSGPDGRRERLEADHVVAATGYDVDIRRLGFLSQGLLEAIATTDGKPALSLAYETTSPGLHIVGPAAAFSFGPVCRFVFGTPHPARAIAARLARGESSSVTFPGAPVRAAAR